MTDQPAYTDADVQAARAAARKCLADFDTVMNVGAESRYVASEILDAVVPAIMARAKAEAWDRGFDRGWYAALDQTGETNHNPYREAGR